AEADRDDDLKPVCDVALDTPTAGNSEVFNVKVGKPCQKGQGFKAGANAGWGVFGVGMATTVLFTVLLLVHKKNPAMETARRHQFRISATPTRGGASLGTSFKF
ncbi:MAG: hypothetical protein JKY37_32250, partial [Nannocystaceae bacterium]|nr:hypothetical protein [Nannocystaceae bacterium]